MVLILFAGISILRSRLSLFHANQLTDFVTDLEIWRLSRRETTLLGGINQYWFHRADYILLSFGGANIVKKLILIKFSRAFELQIILVLAFLICLEILIWHLNYSVLALKFLNILLLLDELYLSPLILILRNHIDILLL